MYAVILDEIFTAISCFTVDFIWLQIEGRISCKQQAGSRKISHLADTQLDFHCSHHAVFDRGWYKYLQVPVSLSVVATSYNINHSSTNFVLPLWCPSIIVCVILHTYTSALHEQQIWLSLWLCRNRWWCRNANSPCHCPHCNWLCHHEKKTTCHQNIRWVQLAALLYCFVHGRYSVIIVI